MLSPNTCFKCTERPKAVREPRGPASARELHLSLGTKCSLCPAGPESSTDTQSCEKEPRRLSFDSHSPHLRLREPARRTAPAPAAARKLTSRPSRPRGPEGGTFWERLGRGGAGHLGMAWIAGAELPGEFEN